MTSAPSDDIVARVCHWILSTREVECNRVDPGSMFCYCCNEDQLKRMEHDVQECAGSICLACEKIKEARENMAMVVAEIDEAVLVSRLAPTCRSVGNLVQMWRHTLPAQDSYLKF